MYHLTISLFHVLTAIVQASKLIRAWR